MLLNFYFWPDSLANLYLPIGHMIYDLADDSHPPLAQYDCAKILDHVTIMKQSHRPHAEWLMATVSHGATLVQPFAKCCIL